MDLIETIANDPAFHLEMDFQPGDIQLLNNSVILHAREAYEDGPEPERRRHLLRLWLAARATGFVAFLLLTLEVAIGLLMSHPENPARWKLSKRVFPWHENLTVFTLAFVLVHVVSLVADPYAGVEIGRAHV